MSTYPTCRSDMQMKIFIILLYFYFYLWKTEGETAFGFDL